jgi:hypothetical protein
MRTRATPYHTLAFMTEILEGPLWNHEAHHRMQYDNHMAPATFIRSICILLITIAGCGVRPPASDPVGWISHPGVFSQQDVAARMLTWRREAWELWRQAAALQREAGLLSMHHPERTEEIQRKREFAAELTRAADHMAEQASLAQRQLPPRMLQ